MTDDDRDELYEAVAAKQYDRVNALLKIGVWSLSAFNVAKVSGDVETARRILSNHPDKAQSGKNGR